MNITPITQKAARKWINEVHRHLSAPRGDVIRVALEVDGRIVGVGMAGRPVARHLDDGRTLEITRVAVQPGVRNGCSKIYGALRKAATALGWERIITYTLESEPGTSPQAAGFRCEGTAGGGEWNCPSRRRANAEAPQSKVRWSWP